MESKGRRTKRGDTEQHLRRAMACVKGIPEDDLPGNAWVYVELATLLRLASDRGLSTVPLGRDGTVDEVVLGREVRRAKAGRRPWEPKRGPAGEASFLPPSSNVRGYSAPGAHERAFCFQVAGGPELGAHPGALLLDLTAVSRRVEELKDKGVEPARIPTVALEGLRALSVLLTPEDARWFLKEKRGSVPHDEHAFERLAELYPWIRTRWATGAYLLRIYRRDRAKVAAEDRRAKEELERRDRGG